MFFDPKIDGLMDFQRAVLHIILIYVNWLIWCDPFSNSGMGLGANLRLDYIGERYYADEPENDVTQLSAYLSKTIYDGVKLFAGIDNIFDAGSASDIEPTFYYAGFSLTY
jgi:hypothetical protein